MTNENPPQKQTCDPIWMWSKKIAGVPCEPLKSDEDRKGFYDRMYATMNYYGGIGIAAPQIGIFKKMVIIDWQMNHLVMINPQVLDCRGESTEFEGCLSIPGASGNGRPYVNRARVTRCSEVEVQYLDMNWNRKEEKFKGYLAHAIFHELDHLEGLFFIDRLGDLTRSMVMNKFKKFLTRTLPDDNLYVTK